MTTAEGTVMRYPATGIACCVVGMHASPRIIDALVYVEEAVLFTRVLVEGDIDTEDV
jgi:hypothetical protein